MIVNNRVQWISIIFLISVLFSVLPTSLAQNTGVIVENTQSPLRVRSGPDVSYQELAQIQWPPSQMLALGVNENRTWVQINYNGIIGWSSRQFLREIQGSIDTLPMTWGIPTPIPTIPPATTSRPQAQQSTTETTNIKKAPVKNGAIAPTHTWKGPLCVPDATCGIGDVNGDGNDDFVVFTSSNSLFGQYGTYVFLSVIGYGYTSPKRWSSTACFGEMICAIGDFNGDGLDDIAEFRKGAGSGKYPNSVLVSLSDGHRFGVDENTGSYYYKDFCPQQAVCGVGNFDGDKKDDFVAFMYNTPGQEGNVLVLLSGGQNQGKTQLWHHYICVRSELCGVGNFDGQRGDDVIAFVGGTGTVENEKGRVYVAVSTGREFGEPKFIQCNDSGAMCANPGVDPYRAKIWQQYYCTGNEMCAVGDMNRDGKDDIVTFFPNVLSPQGGEVLWATSTGSEFVAWAGKTPLYCGGLRICGIGDSNGDKRDEVMFLDLNQY